MTQIRKWLKDLSQRSSMNQRKRQSRRGAGSTTESLEQRALLTAVRMLPGFEVNALPPSDDGSSEAVPFPFEVNFFGQSHDQLYVNNNGNITFDAPLDDWTPDEIKDIPRQIIAPFWADVDTRDQSSGLRNQVTYGVDTVDGRTAFGVTWHEVGYYDQNIDKGNTFQVLLVDRSDVEAGAFDIEFNYDQIEWETGDAGNGTNGFGGDSARAGFSNGTAASGTNYELVGSGIPAGFLNESSSPYSLVDNRLLSTEDGRYVFAVRDGSGLDSLGLAGQTFAVDGGLYLGQGLDPATDFLPQPTNVQSADTMNVLPAELGAVGLSLTGQGVRVGVWEPGLVLPTHQELTGRVAAGAEVATRGDRLEPDNRDHATHVTGTILGSGVDPDARGIAPGATVVFFDAAGDTAEMRVEAGASRIDISNHSYGFRAGWEFLPLTTGVRDVWMGDYDVSQVEDQKFGKHDGRSRDFDALLADFPRLLSVVAAGNEGDGSYQNQIFDPVTNQNTPAVGEFVTHFRNGLGGGPTGYYLIQSGSQNPLPPNDTDFDTLPRGMQNSKNVVTVGNYSDVTADPQPVLPGTDVFSDFADGDVGFANSSSMGPTDDGRIKPDVVANGIQLYSSVAFDPVTRTVATDAYNDFTGTSMAAPSVSGLSALLLEHYRALNGTSPRSATLKSLLIHTANEVGEVGPDYRSGWGLVNGREAAQLISKNVSLTLGEEHSITESQIANGNLWKTPIQFDGRGELRVTLGWTDPAGNPDPDGVDAGNLPRLVNDLDLTLLGPTGTFHFPWTLDPTIPGNAAVQTQRNFRDNVEQVRLTGVPAGEYTIQVSHSGSLQNNQDQAFSLLASSTVCEPDEFEDNNTLQTATVLGSPPFVTLRDLSIHEASDIDYFRYTAHETGHLVINSLFQHSIGDVELEVRDSTDTQMAGAFSSDDNETLTIPVVSQQTYFIRVSTAGNGVNKYALEIENFAAPVPSRVDLDALSDSGRFNNDDLTNDTTPTFDVYADLSMFAQRSINILNSNDYMPQSLNQSARDGAAVFVRVFDSFGALRGNGFADPVGTSSTVFSFNMQDVLGGILDGEYSVVAAVRVFDNQSFIRSSGLGQFSAPLVFELDTTAPVAPFIELAGGSDSGVEGQPGTFTDEYTSDNVPTFTGSAETGSFVDLNGLGRTNTLPDGNTEPPNSTHQSEWRLTSRLDLNDPFFFTPDGLRQIEATATDLAGNESVPSTLDIFLDTQGPTVSGVQYDPSSSVFGTKATASPTAAVDGVSITFTDLPDRNHATGLGGDPKWAHSAVNETLALEVGNYRLIGDATGEVAIASVVKLVDEPNGFNEATATYRLIASQLLPDDRYTLIVSDSITDDAGNSLDGETNTLAPTDTPILPSGDEVPGGDFQARFTVDSRPEIAISGQGDIQVDINGNFRFDPTNSDAAHRDLTFDLGIDTDAVFSGQFTPAGASTADGFDRLGAYGRFNGSYRWLLDFDNNGVEDDSAVSTLQINGLPIAGDFDSTHPGDEIGLFDGTTWWLDSSGNNNIESGDTTFSGNMRGLPFIGDFDGDGLDDLATHYASSNTFYFDLTSANDGSSGTLDGNWDDSFVYGFSGVLERPVAGDVNLDGIDDIALTNPNRDGNASSATLEWYFLVSDINQASAGTVNAILQPANAVPAGTTKTRSFSPAPLGNDSFAQFGNNLSVPLLGNFDPPLEQPANIAPELRVPETLQVSASQTSVTIAVQATDANGDTLSTTARVDSMAWYLDQTLGLYETGNYWQDYFGVNEKWIKDANETWYFIKESGGLYRWDGRKSATGALVAVLDESVHDDPKNLTDAKRTAMPFEVSVGTHEITVTGTVDPSYVVNVNTTDGIESDSKTVMVTSTVGTAIQLDQELEFYSNGNHWEDWGGRNEKWFRDASDQWYFITPDGSVTIWSRKGGAVGTTIAKLEPAHHANLDLLLNASEAALDSEHGFKAASGEFFNWGGRNEKWFRNNDNDWLYILPSGDIFEWDGTQAASGLYLTTVDDSNHKHLGQLYNALDNVFSDWMALLDV